MHNQRKITDFLDKKEQLLADLAERQTNGEFDRGVNNVKCRRK